MMELVCAVDRQHPLNGWTHPAKPACTEVEVEVEVGVVEEVVQHRFCSPSLVIAGWLAAGCWLAGAGCSREREMRRTTDRPTRLRPH